MSHSLPKYEEKHLICECGVGYPLDKGSEDCQKISTNWLKLTILPKPSIMFFKHHT